ncbi:XRE family transcriptional regulator [Enterococcus hirae]|uniref:XRE family transcriptional regulator n=1 Tax=Enterococcus hirae TaxID=1354 RepID=UPI00137719D3|nr:XRE family transcriptional regulator [Enterococcus hirae]NBA56471.1 helix-turn-helix domain-containing protein [Enterococcus hirae]
MENNVIGAQISLLRKKFGLTQEDLANKLGFSKQTISNWETGLKTPRMGAIQKIADLFNVSKSFIIEGIEEAPSTSIEKIYNQLSPPRQQKIYNFAKYELEKQNKSNVVQGNFGKTVDEDVKQEISYIGLLSAGHGYPNYDKERPLGTVTMRESQIPSHYDLAFMVDGDSMYPTFENGEIVFIKQTPDVMNGQIGAVEINGKAFLKKMYVENHRLRFVSLNCECDENGNRLYPDFYADEYDDLYVIGRVIV